MLLSAMNACLWIKYCTDSQKSILKTAVTHVEIISPGGCEAGVVLGTGELSVNGSRAASRRDEQVLLCYLSSCGRQDVYMQGRSGMGRGKD